MIWKRFWWENSNTNGEGWCGHKSKQSKPFGMISAQTDVPRKGRSAFRKSLLEVHLLPLENVDQLRLLPAPAAPE